MTTHWETTRCLIKPTTMADLPHHRRLQSDPDVMKYIGYGRPRSEEEIMENIQKCMAHHNQFGYSLGTVFEKETGDCIGRAGLIHQEYDPENPNIEVGYLLAKEKWGKGYGTELCQFFIEWGFKHINTNRLIALASPDNVGSRRIMEKCGMTFFTETQYKNYGPAVIYEIKRDPQQS